jgi:hippurate hydrolase
MLRADSDALPVREETGLPYASKVTQIDSEGRKVPVMHACGHDMHMTVLVGTVDKLLTEKNRWRGTLVLLVQPAEEKGLGALQVLNDGLFKRFPRPQYNLALHVAADLPAGSFGYTSGYAFANVDTIDIKVRGEGAHGAAPHQSKDPIVLSAQLITALQTIMSRELSPRESAVLTVGSIHGGTQHNVIPNEVSLQLTVRSYGEATRMQLLNAIERTTQGLATAGGYPKAEIKVLESYTPSVYNDPGLTERAAKVLSQTFGPERVQAIPPALVGEDFARYGLVEPRIPSLIFWLGSVAPEQFARSQKEGIKLPTLHSGHFSPDVPRTLDAGVSALTTLVYDLLPPKP